MLVVVPIAEDDGILLIVGVCLLWRVNNDRSAETVDVLTLGTQIKSAFTALSSTVVSTHSSVGVDPVGAPLAGRVDGDNVVECLTGRNTAVKAR